jgi:hypothetical protein
LPKSIVIFSDGTGQAGGIPGQVPSNVYKLFRACPVIPGVQETFYDPGLGSGSKEFRKCSQPPRTPCALT